MDPNAEIELELLPYIRIYKSGRVERLRNSPIVPAGVDAATGVASKDITISPSTGVSARLYLPDLSTTTTTKLPILVYYHGGAFTFESAFSSLYHNHLNLLSAKANLLIVSVEYRLAPEHPLPAAYDDAWEALQWAAGGDADPWLVQHGDFTRVFVAGDSAGGNIAHHVAVRAGTAAPEETVDLEGVMLIHPYFWGSGEDARGSVDPATGEWMQALWKLVCPGTEGDDDPWINPAAEPRRLAVGGRRAVVFVAGKDFLRRKGIAYYEALKASGWGERAGLVETEGEEHVFHLFNPTCESAVDMVKRMAGFFKD